MILNFFYTFVSLEKIKFFNIKILIMKKLSQLFVLVMITGMITSCSQMSNKKSAEGDWTLDSLKITNIQTIYDNQIKQIEKEEKSLQKGLDTMKNKKLKSRIKQRLKRLQQQKPESPEALEKDLSSKLMNIQSDSINVKMDKKGNLILNKKIPYSKDTKLELRVQLKKQDESQEGKSIEGIAAEKKSAEKEK